MLLLCSAENVGMPWMLMTPFAMHAYSIRFQCFYFDCAKRLTHRLRNTNTDTHWHRHRHEYAHKHANVGWLKLWMDKMYGPWCWMVRRLLCLFFAHFTLRCLRKRTLRLIHTGCIHRTFIHNVRSTYRHTHTHTRRKFNSKAKTAATV